MQLKDLGLIALTLLGVLPRVAGSDESTRLYRDTQLVPETAPDDVEVAAGGYFTLVRDASGKVFASGSNTYGQLGNGTTTGSLTPVQVSGLTNVNVVQIAAGGYHSLALGSDGSVWAWGQGSYGQLGNGQTTNAKYPVKVTFPPGTVIEDISAGGYHSMAIDNKSQLWSWGRNQFGQLCDNSTTNRTKPVLIPQFVSSVSAGFGFSLLIHYSDGKVMGCGSNSSGQLGDGTTTQRMVATLTNPALYATNISAGGAHSVAISGSKVYTWGENKNCQLGIGSASSPKTSPVISLMTSASDIHAGYFHTLATQISPVGPSQVVIMGWGVNSNGQLGTGDLVDKCSPSYSKTSSGQKFTQGADDSSVSAGWFHSSANSYSATYTWGDGSYGQLGNGTTSDSIYVKESQF